MAERPERDELDRAVRRLEAERVAPPVRKPNPYPVRASLEQLRAFDADWRGLE